MSESEIARALSNAVTQLVKELKPFLPAVWTGWVDLLLGLLGTTAAFLAARAAAISARIMKETQEASYQPWLAVHGRRGALPDILCERLTESLISAHFHQQGAKPRVKNEDGTEAWNPSAYYLVIHNIGNGPALSADVTFRVPGEKPGEVITETTRIGPLAKDEVKILYLAIVTKSEDKPELQSVRFRDIRGKWSGPAKMKRRSFLAEKPRVLARRRYSAITPPKQ